MNRAIVLIGLCVIAGCAQEPKYQSPAPIPRGFETGNPCSIMQPSTTVPPAYPRGAAAYGQRGWVALKYHVAPNGVPFNIRVAKSSPQGIFEVAAIQALSRWRYPPIDYPVQNCAHLDVFQPEDR